MIQLNQAIQKNKEKVVFFLFFLVNLLILSFSNFKDSGDDLAFQQAATNFSWWNFSISRYFNWSGRLVPDTLSYFFNSSLAFLWPFFNAAVFTLLSILFFKYINLFFKLKTNHKYLLALIICLSFLLINQQVISPAFVWRTGSLNYLWPTVLGLLAFYPFLLSIKNKIIHKNYFLYFLIGLLASICTEQVSVALIFGIAIYIFYMIAAKKKIPPIIYLLSITIFLGSLIILYAPGNQVRFQKETMTNFPDFLSLTIFNRVSISLYWILNKIINNMDLLLAPTFLILGIKNYKKSTKIISLISIFLGVLFLIKGIFQIEYKIYPITSDNYLSIGILTSYFLSFLALFFIPYLIWRLYKFGTKTLIFYSIIVLIFILMVMITLSPTMDISGSRTIFLSSVLLNLFNLFLLLD